MFSLQTKKTTEMDTCVHILFFHWGWGCRPCSIPSPPPLHRKRHICYLMWMSNGDGCSDQLEDKLKQQNIHYIL